MNNTIQIKAEVNGAWKLNVLRFVVYLLDKINMPHFKKADIIVNVKMNVE